METININPIKLYHGCILAAVTHAVTVGEYPELDYEHSWDEINYCMNNSFDVRGVVTFHKEYIVAAFQDTSKINIDEDINAYDYFAGASDAILDIAKTETLMYLLEDINGVKKPVISSAFFGTWETLYSNQTIYEIFKNGGSLIETQLLDYNDALRRYDYYYGLNSNQMFLIDSLYQRKIKDSAKTITLNDNEIKSLYGEIDKCKESLNELNIVF